MFVAKAFLVASLALSASALVTPHAARNVDHHALAARRAAAEPVAPAVVQVTPRRKRSLAKRCQPHASSSAAPASSATPAAPASSAPPAESSPAPVNNAGAEPPKAPVHTPSPSPTEAPATTHTTHTSTHTSAAPAPSKPANTGGSGNGQTFSGDGTCIPFNFVSQTSLTSLCL